jgi:chromate transporter
MTDVPFRSAARAWFAISLQTFGGPAGQIAVMQRSLVDERGWIGQQRFLHALNYCMLLPGPEAQQLATYIGWLLNGTRGALVAGGLFVAPGVVAMLALSAIYVAFGSSTPVTAAFAGIAAAVLAIVAQALLRVARRVLTGPWLVALAAAAFVALAAFAVPFPVVIAAAAVVGWLLGRRAEPESAADAEPPAARPSARRAARILAVGLLAWGVPVLAAATLTGTGGVLTRQGLFFSGAALLTFGGAYAVLAYVAQQAVQVYGWLTPAEMVRGLGLAETTPGPLIMVVQFVAFLGAYRDPGRLDPWLAALLGALLTTWVTFVPGVVLVLLGAPYVERLRGNPTLAAALRGITAAVVGVIGNLALWFAVHTLFSVTGTVAAGPVRLTVPDVTSMRRVTLGIALLAAVMVFPLRWPILRTLAACATLGVLAAAAGWAVA